MTPPWSGSWLPVPTSMPWTTMVVASELDESTRILHKSVGILLQNIDIFAGSSICLNFKLIEIVVGCGGKRKVNKYIKM